MSYRLFGEDSDHAGDAMHDFYTRDDLLDGGDFAEMFARPPLRRVRAAQCWPCGCAFVSGYVHRCEQIAPVLNDGGERGR
ncbi:hypothetical protein [Phenylobacterium immobile]|uniref:hypothetical protein n=1 Tax=Phenylobacterium immobile TaxID=21 RepID=UPI000A50F251|nr:hypothetical protein [Phenylobacterium immobile]